MSRIADLGYQLMDADAHYYEPYDCFTRHIETAFEDRVVSVVKGDDGLGRLYFGAERLSFYSVIQSDYIGAPGSLRELFESDGSDTDSWGFEQRDLINAHDFPAFMQRDARLALMDEQGVEATYMLPSLGVVVEPSLERDVPAAMANFRSFNRWLEDDWGFGADGRIIGVPYLPLLDLDLAVAELERVLAAGARAILLRCGPVLGRSPADPYFDPFWARVHEAGVPVLFHGGDSGYYKWFGSQWSEDPSPNFKKVGPFQFYSWGVERAASDTMAALVLHNLFGRFPRLRVVSIENGTTWVRPLLWDMDKAAKLGASGRWIGGKLTEKPSNVFLEHVWATPFFEEDCVDLISVMGAERVLFGSDFPHPEGIEEPSDFLLGLPGVPASDVQKIMRANMEGLLTPTSAGISVT